MPEVSTRSRAVEIPGGELRLSWAEVTHTGRRREINQDAVLSEYPLFVVADGMGGHIGGEIASASAVERLRAVAATGTVTPKAVEKALARAVKDIAAHPETTDEGTGTTVTGVFLDLSGDAPHWVTLNIGDSRVYLARDGSLIQVTTDHSVVQELVAAGRLSPEEAEGHPYGNVITRAVGPSDGVRPDYVRLDIADGDRFVICSDGLTKELTDYGILHFLDENPDPADAVTAMLDAALENGGRDNITLIVLDVRDTTHAAEDDAAHAEGDDEMADAEADAADRAPGDEPASVDTDADSSPAQS